MESPLSTQHPWKPLHKDADKLVTFNPSSKNLYSLSLFILLARTCNTTNYLFWETKEKQEVYFLFKVTSPPTNTILLLGDTYYRQSQGDPVPAPCHLASSVPFVWDKSPSPPPCPAPELPGPRVPGVLPSEASCLLPPRASLGGGTPPLPPP